MGTRYRTGIDAATGKVLVGWPHCAQSVLTILTTMLGERAMRLDFGSELISHIGDELDAITVPKIYRDAVTAIHRNEPEFRIHFVQLVKVERTGGLGLELRGDYHPEGRLGNFKLVEPVGAAFPFVYTEAGGTRA